MGDEQSGQKELEVQWPQGGKCSWGTMSGGGRAGRIEIGEVAGPGRRGKEERREAMNVLILRVRKMVLIDIRRVGWLVRADGGDQDGSLFSQPSKRCWWRRLGQ